MAAMVFSAGFVLNIKAFMTTFIGNTVDLANRADSIGARISTDGFGWGSADVAATFTGNNVFVNADTGIRVYQEPGYTASAIVDGNAASIHGNVIAMTFSVETGTIRKL